MLDTAAAGSHALPAVNVTSSETLNGALRGFAEARSDGNIQVTTHAGAFLSGGAIGDMALGARALAEYAHVVGEQYPVLIALRTDHATPDRFDAFAGPLIEESRWRVRCGAKPLFHSHMFDGSSLPLEENLRRSASLLEELAPLGVVLEVQSGVVGGAQDEVTGPKGDDDALCTTSNDLMRVAAALGTGQHGRYLLAATFGNVHGVHASRRARLRPEILAEGQAALAERHPGRRFQHVFHGSSGSDPADLRASIQAGVVKVNLDTDAQYAFTRVVAGHGFLNYDGVLKVDGDGGRTSAYDPRSWGATPRPRWRGTSARRAGSSAPRAERCSHDQLRLRYSRTASTRR
jgi:fructose-bisphosphate aldolase, class II